MIVQINENEWLDLDKVAGLQVDKLLQTDPSEKEWRLMVRTVGNIAGPMYVYFDDEDDKDAFMSSWEHHVLRKNKATLSEGNVYAPAPGTAPTNMLKKKVARKRLSLAENPNYVATSGEKFTIPSGSSVIDTFAIMCEHTAGREFEINFADDEEINITYYTHKDDFVSTSGMGYKTPTSWSTND